MIKSNSGTYKLDIQKRIASARQETRTLYYEVENIRSRIQMMPHSSKWRVMLKCSPRTGLI